MALNINKLAQNTGGKDFKPQAALEADTYMCRVAQIITKGLQPQRAFQGEAKPPCDAIDFTYEFVTEFMQDEEGNDMEDKPRWLTEQNIPIKGGDLAKLTKRYRAIDPKGTAGGDVLAIAGMPCMVTITKSAGKDQQGNPVERNYVANVAPAPKGIPFPELQNPTKVFDVDAPDLEVLESLPDWKQKQITDNLRYQGSALQAALEGVGAKAEQPAEAANEGDDDDLPY